MAAGRELKVGLPATVVGDPGEAFKNCDKVIEGEAKMGSQYHFFMETHVCVSLCVFCCCVSVCVFFVMLGCCLFVCMFVCLLTMFVCMFISLYCMVVIFSFFVVCMHQ